LDLEKPTRVSMFGLSGMGQVKARYVSPPCTEMKC
jgi:hypothetical protein